MANFIVAIELGSSKITGIAGRKKEDGSLDVMAVVTEDAAACIQRGNVYNIGKSATCISNIIDKLRSTLKADITKVFVGIGGKSIHSVQNVIDRDLPQGTMITEEIIDRINDQNHAEVYPNHMILDDITQEYKVDTQYQLDPVGISCSHLEGNFLNILYHKSYYSNLNKCFEQAGVRIDEIFLAPRALAACVLTENERRNGCILVDMGAATTKLLIYDKNILRSLIVLPLGGNNITKDIASLGMDEKEAERMKKKYGAAYTDPDRIDYTHTLKYPVDQKRDVESSKFIEIVEARVDEIIKNVWIKVPAKYQNCPLILTGGAANMPNMEEAFRRITNIDKIRIAKNTNLKINSNIDIINNSNGIMNTAIGLLAYTKVGANCAGMELPDENQTAEPVSNSGAAAQTGSGVPSHAVGSSNTNIGSSAVITSEEERKKAEEERKRAEQERKKREEEEKKKEEEELQKIKEEEEKNRKKKKRWNRIKEKIKNWGTQIISEED